MRVTIIRYCILFLYCPLYCMESDALLLKELIPYNTNDTVILIDDSEYAEWHSQLENAFFLPLAAKDGATTLSQTLQKINSSYEHNPYSDSFLYNFLQLPPKIQHKTIATMISLNVNNFEMAENAAHIFLHSPFLYSIKNYYSAQTICERYNLSQDSHLHIFLRNAPKSTPVRVEKSYWQLSCNENTCKAGFYSMAGLGIMTISGAGLASIVGKHAFFATLIGLSSMSVCCCVGICIVGSCKKYTTVE